MNRKLVGALLSCGVLLLGAAFANAAGSSYSSKLTIKAKLHKPSGGYLISGKLTSKKKACVKGRVVGVHLKGIGEKFPVSQAVVKSNGTWAVSKNYPINPGRYWATVDKLKLKKGSCKAERSKTITGKVVKPAA